MPGPGWEEPSPHPGPRSWPRTVADAGGLQRAPPGWRGRRPGSLGPSAARSSSRSPTRCSRVGGGLGVAWPPVPGLAPGAPPLRTRVAAVPVVHCPRRCQQPCCVSVPAARAPRGFWGICDSVLMIPSADKTLCVFKCSREDGDASTSELHFRLSSPGASRETWRAVGHLRPDCGAGGVLSLAASCRVAGALSPWQRDAAAGASCHRREDCPPGAGVGPAALGSSTPAPSLPAPIPPPPRANPRAQGKTGPVHGHGCCRELLRGSKSPRSPRRARMNNRSADAECLTCGFSRRLKSLSRGLAEVAAGRSRAGPGIRTRRWGRTAGEEAAFLACGPHAGRPRAGRGWEPRCSGPRPARGRRAGSAPTVPLTLAVQ